MGIYYYVVYVLAQEPPNMTKQNTQHNLNQHNYQTTTIAMKFRRYLQLCGNVYEMLNAVITILGCYKLSRGIQMQKQDALYVFIPVIREILIVCRDFDSQETLKSHNMYYNLLASVPSIHQLRYWTYTCRLFLWCTCCLFFFQFVQMYVQMRILLNNWVYVLSLTNI